MDTAQFEGRKRDHIRHALDASNQASGLSGLSRVRLRHEALPELDLNDIRLESNCLGFPLKAPFYFAGMTAGHGDAPALNLRFARAAQARGWAMGVGSQRRELDRASVDRWQELRKECPKLVLFANLGLSQLHSVSVDQVRRVVDGLQAQALCIHLNVLQEAMQPEGTPFFRGGIQKIRELVGTLGRPVVLKETGCGFSRKTLEKVASIGVAAVDVSGLGGTHWGKIEGARAAESQQDPLSRRLARAAQVFGEWGESTVDSVRAASQVLPTSTQIWASGGVRTGLDSAKLIALGAHMVGYAKPALEAALLGEEALDEWMEQQEFELKVALLCSGHSHPESLRRDSSGTLAVRDLDAGV